MTEAKISPKKIPIEDWVKAVKKIEAPDLKDDEKKIFDAVKSHKNIPKTSTKFSNFCIHNLKVKNEKLINKIWGHLSGALEQQCGPAKVTIETKKNKLDKKLAPKKDEAKSDVKKVSFSNNGSPDESKASKKAGSKAKVHEPTPRKLPDVKAAKLEAMKAAKKQKKQKLQQKQKEEVNADDDDDDDDVDEEPVTKKAIVKNGVQKGAKGSQKATAPIKGGLAVALKSALKKDDQSKNSKVNSQKNKKNQATKKEAVPTKNGTSEVSKKKVEAQTKGLKPALKTTAKNTKFDQKKKKKQDVEDSDEDDDDDDEDDDELGLDSDDDIDFSDSDAISMDDEAMGSVSSDSDEEEDDSEDDELLSFDEEGFDEEEEDEDE